eukprot:scaffold45118_cov16-Prasinocladus_malaysianus.AAC.1
MSRGIEEHIPVVKGAANINKFVPHWLSGMASQNTILAIISDIIHVHCENGEAVALGQSQVFGSGITGPEVGMLTAVMQGQCHAISVSQKPQMTNACQQTSQLRSFALNSEALSNRCWHFDVLP